jgi:cysteine desulfurase/selenocysteine lyase
MDIIKYIDKIRQDFPALKTKVFGKPLAYLDNAATTQKPQLMLDAIEDYYSAINANVHRGVHFLSESATEAYEGARQRLQQFINAKHSNECIFVRGTTEAINLVATSFGQQFVKQGDEIVLTQMEHHSNIVPWKLLCERSGAELRIIPVNNNGELELSNLDAIFSERTKIVAVTHISNSLGTINPVKEIISKAHERNIPVLIDGAQAAAHIKIDVQDLDCDFYVLSAHKCYGPMGVGLLYAKQKWLEQMPPYQGGGDMILQVTFEKITYNSLPFKFEAGTPSVADAIGWHAALDYLAHLDHKAIAQHEKVLLEYCVQRLQELPHLKFWGTAKNKAPIVSFTLDDIHPHDIGTIVNEYGVAVRTGHHCNMPLMDSFGITGTVRASFGLYNTIQEVDQLCDALQNVHKIFRR